MTDKQPVKQATPENWDAFTSDEVSDWWRACYEAAVAKEKDREHRQTQAWMIQQSVLLAERDAAKDAIRGLLPYVDTSKASAFRAIEAAEKALEGKTDA